MNVFIKIINSFWKAKKSFKWFALTAIIFSCLAQLFGSVMQPYYVSKIIDTLPKGQSAVAVPFTMLLVYVVAKFLSYRIGGVALAYTEANTMRNLENTIFRKIMYRSIQFHDRHESGKIMNRMMKYVSAYEVVFDQTTFTILPSLTVGIGATILAFGSLPIQFGLIIVGTVLLFCIVSYYMIKLQQPYNIEKSERSSKMNQRLADVLANIANVKVDAEEKTEIARYEEANKKRYKARILNWMYGELKSAAQSLIIEGVLICFTAYYCIHLYYLGKLSIGGIILITTCCGNIAQLLWNLGRMLKSLMDAYADAQETIRMISEPVDIVEAPDAVDANIQKGAIQFNNISFHYPTNQHPVLHGFTLDIQAGEKVAIVGATGSGKSTLMKLLFRMYDIQGGEITIDGVDIQKMKLNSLRKSIAYVGQNPTLFNRAVIENITYGLRDDEADIEKAIELAQCDFVYRLENGLQTRVGEQGKQLSGGEKQRIAIARAILHNTPILVLDEATSALDNHSEKEVSRAINSLLKYKKQTAIIIAHRLTTIMHCDRIIVMSYGSIVEQGSHTTLLEKGGIYAKLWNKQFEE